MLKKISFILLCVLIAGCRSTAVSTRGGVQESFSDISEVNLGTSRDFRVGVLLPLSGAAAKEGQGLKNATLMAMEDVDNPNLILQFYDTNSSESGARIAAENALRQRSKIILGPLMSKEVKAITPQVSSRGVPVIAFSSSEEVLQPGIFTLGLLINEQVDRIMTYAAENGRSRFALLVPDNKTGMTVAKAAVSSAQRNGVDVVRIAFYAPETNDFSDILKQMTDYSIRANRLKKVRESFEKRSQNGDVAASKALKRLETLDTLGEVDFDAVLIPESGPRLKSAISMFGYYDVFAPQVRFLGTSIWENTKLNNETTVVGSWYPTMSRSHGTYFANKYNTLFGEKPSSLYSFAYDGVALAAALAPNPDQNLDEAITNPDGYLGINGVFRFFPNGTNQHSLDIMQITSAGDVVVNAAPRKFSTYNRPLSPADMIIDSSYKAPLIFGKNSAAAQTQIYGYPLPPENQQRKDPAGHDEHQIVKDSLKKVNIQIP